MKRIRWPTVYVAADDVAPHFELLLHHVVVIRAERLERAGEELLDVALVGFDVVAHQEAPARILLSVA
jgi:hypothetical protein